MKCKELLDLLTSWLISLWRRILRYGVRHFFY